MSERRSILLFGDKFDFIANNEIQCGFCNRVYNKGLSLADAENVPYVVIADKKVCSCCFGEIESFVSNFFPSIVRFVENQIEDEKKRINQQIDSLELAKPIAKELEEAMYADYDYAAQQDDNNRYSYQEMYGHTPEQDDGF
ncbi:MAG: hypothetical protein WCQ49_02585 [Candidatus Saccharibacteria bacterium]